MKLMRHILHSIAALLVSALSAMAMPMAPTGADQVDFPPHQETLVAKQTNVHFAARAPPMAVADVAITDAAAAEHGNGIVMHGHKTHVASLELGVGLDAPKGGIFDFDRGRTSGSYDALNPGPLDDSLAGTFSGGRYNEVVLTEDVVLHRAGTGDRPLGQFFTQQPADGILQSRIDSAVLPTWPGGGTSPINSTFEVRIPAGTRVYVGEVSSQGGAFVGGTQQIVVPRPWEIDGVEVLSRTPLP